MGNNISIFGRFKNNEDGKTSSLSCRVSKETRDLFKAHAESKFGDVSTGLKEILFDYMSQYPFKRQTFIGVEFNIFVPIFKERDDYDFLPFDVESVYSDIYVPEWKDVGNLNEIIYSVNDYREFNPPNDWDHEFEIDKYEELVHWLRKDSNFTIEDGIIIHGNLNNVLDKKIDGTYKAIKESDNFHEGLVIFEFEEKYHYIIFRFEVIKNKGYIDFTTYASLVSNEEAYEKAIESDNIELANFIDNLNEGTSNIEKNKQALINKKEYLINQIKEIDEKLSKL